MDYDIDNKTLLVIDEVSMVGRRQLIGPGEVGKESPTVHIYLFF